MKIEKTECSYKVTECDLKFGEQIELDGELLISASKIRADIEQMDFDFGDYYDHTETIIEMVLKVIDKYETKPKDIEAQAT